MNEYINQLIHWAVEATRGGAETIQAVRDDQRTMLDLGEGDPETLLMTGAEQTLYEMTGSTHIYAFAGLYIDWTGLNFGGGEDTTIQGYIKVDGTNYRLVYTETFLAAALPVPVVTVHPRNTNTDILIPTLYLKQDFKLTATQAAVGAGWNTLAFINIDAARGA